MNWKQASIRSLVVLTALSLTALLPDDALAQPERNPASPWYRADSERRWNLDVFVGAESEPDYTGSDDYDTEPGGLLRVTLHDRWNNRYQLGLGDVVGIFDLSPKWAVAAKLEYEEGREVENPELAGFEPGEDTLEGQFSLFRRFGNVYAAGVFQPDLLGRGKGIVWFAALGYDPPVRGSFRWGASLDLSWGDDEHMQTEFGITPEQAAASGLPEYRSEGGLKSTTGGLSLQWYLGERWSVLGNVEVERYFSRAADSPLIDRLGSDTTYEASLGVLYSF